MNVFVERINAKIVGVYANCQSGYAEEELSDSDPEVMAFRDPPALPVTSVSARQFKLQLLATGLLDRVEIWVKAQEQAVQIAYASSGSFVRSEPMMQTGFSALGFSPTQIDDFFVAASAL